MFQDGQLFDHLTVARNVGYALRLRRAPSIAARVERAARAGRPRGVRRPAAGHAVRRRAAAGRAGPLRSPYGPGCCCSTSRSPPSTPGCASGSPTDLRAILRPGGDHRADGHPRPRGGVHRRRPAGGDARRPDRPAGRDRRGLAGARSTPRPRSSSATPGCSRAPPAGALLAAAGLPDADAAVAVRRSAFRSTPDGGRCAGRWSRPGSTPEQVRLVVDVDGVGELDAVAPARPAPRRRRAGAARRSTRPAPRRRRLNALASGSGSRSLH